MLHAVTQDGELLSWDAEREQVRAAALLGSRVFLPCRTGILSLRRPFLQPSTGHAVVCMYICMAFRYMRGIQHTGGARGGAFLTRTRTLVRLRITSLLPQLKSRIDLVDDGAAFPMAGAPPTGSIAGMQYLQLDEAVCVAYANGDLMLCTLDGSDVSTTRRHSPSLSAVAAVLHGLNPRPSTTSIAGAAG